MPQKTLPALRIVIGVLLTISVCSACTRPSRSAETDGEPQRSGVQGRGQSVIVTAQGLTERKVMVEPGTPEEATDYYATIDRTFEPFDSFNRILEYFGYPGMTGNDLETLASGVLMDPSNLFDAIPDPKFRAAVTALPLRTGEILASRFFAPKITDVSLNMNPALLGWRKVVRLKARTQSRAENGGLQAAWFLFNVFSNDTDPFKSRSLNNQVILQRAAGATTPPDPIYWLVYGSVASGDGSRIDYLEASFDARAPHLGKGKYYVPTACAHCHGGLAGTQPDFPAAKLNYLDTDHWFDRTKDDFQHIPAGVGVIVDGGTDVTTPRFKAAFDVLRTLNAEVRDQNVAVTGPNPPGFQLRAVETWLRLHQQDYSFADMFDRNVTPSGGAQWTKADTIDRQLLPLLNRFCFRCHSSVEYHVFDKAEVVRLSNRMIRRLNKPATDDDAMPQDRDLRDPSTTKERDCLLKLLAVVGQNKPVTCGPVPEN